MKRASLILVSALLLLFSGCASLWKTMGVATVADETAREQAADRKMADIQRLMDELGAATVENKAAAQRIVELDSRMAELATAVEAAERAGVDIEEIKLRLENLPDDTLRRLADLLDAALTAP